jgi:hypothetical protein
MFVHSLRVLILLGSPKTIAGVFGLGITLRRVSGLLHLGAIPRQWLRVCMRRCTRLMMPEQCELLLQGCHQMWLGLRLPTGYAGQR